MNMMPDENLLAQWLEDELQGEKQAMVEVWASSKPEQLAAREEVRRWKREIKAVMPAEEEPPYPDFFNSRIEQAIRDLGRVEGPLAEPKPRGVPFWRSWLMPTTAFAGMVLAFVVGKQTATPVTVMVDPPRPVVELAPMVYTPDRAVNAEWFASGGADATVIVLDGVQAIPDTMDFWDTAAVPQGGEGSSTAGQDLPNPEEVTQ